VSIAPPVKDGGSSMMILNEAAAVAAKPPMRDGCVCAAVYAPVCGYDNNTYSNSCDAGCRGVKVKSPGVCGSSSPEEGEGAAPAGLPPAGGEGERCQWLDVLLVWGCVITICFSQPARR
jgi:hypothetical protein